MTAPALLAFAALCNDAADTLSDQISALGPKPQGVAEAAAWNLSVQRLNGQINSLTRMAIEDSALAVSEALADEQDSLDQLQDVTDAAEERIRKIEKTSALLTTVSRVLDVGLALLTVAHDPSGIKGLASAITALKNDVDER